MKRKVGKILLATVSVMLVFSMCACSFTDMADFRLETDEILTDTPPQTEEVDTDTPPQTNVSAPAGSIGQTDSSEGRGGIADIVSRISDSVVAINVYGTAYDYFYREYPTEGAGSGVIISDKGYIVTNNHVITGGDSITVFLQNGESYPAEVVGSDESADIAVLKINADGLAPAIIGKSSSLRVGDTAIAIGNPLGELQGTVTCGIISALDREVVIDNRTMILMQTDAAINPGNSGGGLFDSLGHLIGVVVAKSSSNNAEGLGFVIPIDTAMPIINDLINYGYVTGRPTLGIETVDITSAVSAWQNNVNRLGVYVSSVEASGPAHAAGIKRADCIATVDGKEIRLSSELDSLISSKSPGDKVKLGIWRTKTHLEITVTLGEDKNAS